jgi:hypothetical protein
MASGDRNYDIATETTQNELKILIQEIKDSLANSSGVVRHIQRGQIVFNNTDITVGISLDGFTNPDKMIVLLNGSDYFSSNANDMSQTYDYYIESLSVSELVVSRHGATDIKERAGSYQVIEFY